MTDRDMAQDGGTDSPPLGGGAGGGVMWHQDAKYFYYPHGPLARTELGHHKVQGIDHAYTLQGWLKAVNANTLHPDNDMAQDGSPSALGGGGAGGGVHGNIGRDAFGYSLHYYEGDYTPKAAASAPVFLADASGSALASASQPLYNGNISRMVTSVSDFTVSPILGSAFRYDQLNRLVKAVHYDDMASNQWGAPLPSGEGSGEGSHSPEKDSDHYSAYFYDANGNIKRLERNAHGTDVHMDRMTYTYPEHSNRLTTVNDTVPSGTWATDFDDMADDFIYDLDGRLIVDPSAQIYGINWNAQGKVRTIGREGGSTKATLLFHYDGMGNRIRKVSIPKDGSGGFLPLDQWDITYYIRDAQGNHLTTLDRKIVPIDEDEAYDELHIKETVMYGSDRLGVRNWAALPSWQGGAGGGFIAKRVFTHTGLDNPENFPEPDDYTGSVITSTAPANYARHLEGLKRYELKNHLGNVLATVSDKRDVVDDSGDVLYYQPKVDNISFYYPFGSLMPGLSDLGGEHRFGFQGQERVDEVNGNSRHLNFTFRGYDPATGRFWSVDPLAPDYPWNSTYAFSENRVIDGIELEGLEILDADEARFKVTNGMALLDLSTFRTMKFNMELTYGTFHSNTVQWKTSVGSDGSIGQTPTGPLVAGQHHYRHVATHTPPVASLRDVEGDWGTYHRSPQLNRQARRAEARGGNGRVIAPPRAGVGSVGIGVVNLINYTFTTYGSFARMWDSEDVQRNFDAYEQAFKMLDAARYNWSDQYNVDVNDRKSLDAILEYLISGKTDGISQAQVDVARDILEQNGRLRDSDK